MSIRWKVFSLPLVVFAILLTSSCQKEMSLESAGSSTGGGPTPPPAPPVIVADSAWYISYMKRTGIEINDIAAADTDTSENYYSYAAGKIIHKFRYKYDGQVDSAQFSFYYDAANNLLKYENDNMFSGCTTCGTFNGTLKSAVFTYSGSKVAEASLSYFGGNTAKQQFSYSADGKIITVYDTLPASWAFNDILIYRYFLNTDKTTDSAQFITIDQTPTPGDDRDTSWLKYTYDGARNITRIVYGFNDLFTTTTTISSRESRGSEINSTLQKILSNLYYHDFMRANTNDALVFGADGGDGFSFARNTMFPAISIQQGAATGIFTNTFNAANLLTRQVIPDPFATKITGPSTIDYIYIKTTK